MPLGVQIHDAGAVGLSPIIAVSLQSGDRIYKAVGQTPYHTQVYCVQNLIEPVEAQKIGSWDFDLRFIFMGNSQFQYI